MKLKDLTQSELNKIIDSFIFDLDGTCLITNTTRYSLSDIDMIEKEDVTSFVLCSDAISTTGVTDDIYDITIKLISTSETSTVLEFKTSKSHGTVQSVQRATFNHHNDTTKKIKSIVLLYIQNLLTQDEIIYPIPPQNLYENYGFYDEFDVLNRRDI